MSERFILEEDGLYVSVQDLLHELEEMAKRREGEARKAVEDVATAVRSGATSIRVEPS